MKTFTFSSAVVLLGSLQGLLAGTTPASKAFDVVKRAPALPLQVTKIFGEPHGKAFDDKDFVSRKQKILEVAVAGCDNGQHLTHIGLYYGQWPKKNSRYQPPRSFALHGPMSYNTRGLKMDTNEFITKVRVTKYMAKTGFMHGSKRTRIGSIHIETSKKQTLDCGGNAGDDFIDWHYDGYALAYLTGSQGDAIDALAGVFMPIDQYLAN